MSAPATNSLVIGSTVIGARCHVADRQGRDTSPWRRRWSTQVPSKAPTTSDPPITVANFVAAVDGLDIPVRCTGAQPDA